MRFLSVTTRVHVCVCVCVVGTRAATWPAGGPCSCTPFRALNTFETVNGRVVYHSDKPEAGPDQDPDKVLSWG